MSNTQSPHQLGTNIFFTQSSFHECRCSLKTESGASLVSDWAGYHRPSKSGPKIPNSCRPRARMDGMVGGMTKLWWRHQGGFKVRAVTLLSPPGKYRARKWVGLMYTRKEESILLLIVIFSTFIHQLPCTHKHRNAFSMIKCSSSGKPLHRCETDVSMLFQWEISTLPHWVNSNQLANIFLQCPKNDTISQSRKGYTSMKSTAYGKYRLQIWRTLSPVLFLLARLSWGELLSKRKIV